MGRIGEPVADAVPPAPSNGVRYTYSYYVPWDRPVAFRRMSRLSDRPYVSSCPTESVAVSGAAAPSTP